MEKETERKIGQLQTMEQNINSFLMQKHQFQNQILEIDSALKELKNTENAYKIAGSIMIKADRNELEKELQSKREIIELRIKTIEKQENQIKEKSKELQNEVMKEMNKK